MHTSFKYDTVKAPYTKPTWWTKTFFKAILLTLKENLAGIYFINLSIIRSIYCKKNIEGIIMESDIDKLFFLFSSDEHYELKIISNAQIIELLPPWVQDQQRKRI